MLNQDFWRKYFKVYDVLNLIIPYQELLNEIIKEAEIKESDLILDAGTGTGNLALFLERNGGKIIGLDFSQDALNICKKKNPNIKIILHDLTQKLPFPDNTFDIVVSNNVLYNIPRDKRLEVVRELKRILKINGRIVLSNLHKNFKPIKIYLDHIKKQIKNKGYFYTTKQIFILMIPTIKMFYYNSKIKKENKEGNYSFFDLNEQKELLGKVGFVNLSETKRVFSNQAFLNSGFKQ